MALSTTTYYTLYSAESVNSMAELGSSSSHDCGGPNSRNAADDLGISDTAWSGMGTAFSNLNDEIRDLKIRSSRARSRGSPSADASRGEFELTRGRVRVRTAARPSARRPTSERAAKPGCNIPELTVTSPSPRQPPRAPGDLSKSPTTFPSSVRPLRAQVDVSALTTTSQPPHDLPTPTSFNASHRSLPNPMQHLRGLHEHLEEGPPPPPRPSHLRSALPNPTAGEPAFTHAKV
ncbi:uncharacterized protein SCHCODRAFT_01106673 [Schizophyllum commune H4-8]|nr:uncharacterized protein SCHCODRAFT_01106673 [Schizophyllum commune H4-8]KAI5885881.1 hypothetical protein SCHCODRAFT_01106673 [Schizophyllum commune H4-8]